MPLRALAVATAIMLALAGMAMNAQAQTRHEQAATSKKKPTVPTPGREPVQGSAEEPAPEGRIACTIGGCHPIPANCTTTMGQTPMGATGYEIVQCP